MHHKHSTALLFVLAAATLSAAPAWAVSLGLPPTPIDEVPLQESFVAPQVVATDSLGVESQAVLTEDRWNQAESLRKIHWDSKPQRIPAWWAAPHSDDDVNRLDHDRDYDHDRHHNGRGDDDHDGDSHHHRWPGAGGDGGTPTVPLPEALPLLLAGLGSLLLVGRVRRG